jgi:hypothetical protein
MWGVFAECAGHVAAEPAKGKARSLNLSRFGDIGKNSSTLPNESFPFYSIQ